jgi:hypothetical protein
LDIASRELPTYITSGGKKPFIRFHTAKLYTGGDTYTEYNDLFSDEKSVVIEIKIESSPTLQIGWVERYIIELNESNIILTKLNVDK